MSLADERQEKFSGTKPVADAARFDEARLIDWMAAHVEGFQGPLSVEQFKGGQSNPTYALTTPARAYVLRRKPPGKLLPSAHAVDREFRVISALHATGFPVPRPYGLCEDEDVIGTIFYIMERVHGRIIWNNLLPDSTPAERRAIYEAKIKTLAALHKMDYAKLGLDDFGKPGNYFARQISRWSKQYQASETRSIPAMDRLIAWLPDHIPDDDATSIVHGDYRLDNMILHPDKPEVLAVLDWELSTLGHPLGDFTYHLMQWYMPAHTSGAATASLANVDLPALGIPTAEEYAALYCAHTGRKAIENMDFYAAYNMFRLAGILQGIVGRVRDGTASNEHAADMEASVPPLAEAGWVFAQKAGAV